MPKKVVQVNSNPNKTPARTSKNVEGRNPKYDYSQNAFESREGTGPYGQPTFDKNAKIKPLKINTNPNTKSAAPRTRTSGLSGRAIGDVGRIGGGGLPEENR